LAKTKVYDQSRQLLSYTLVLDKLDLTHCELGSEVFESVFLYVVSSELIVTIIVTIN